MAVPTLTREQAVEQLNRLFPAGNWKEKDLQQAEVSYGLNDVTVGPFRMWLPLLSPDLNSIVRWRLNMPPRATDLRITPVDKPTTNS